MSTITITFKAKLDDFAGGKGYKVPTLTSSHVTITKGDSVSTIVVGSIDRVVPERTRARLRKFYGIDLPGVVWESGASVGGISVNDPRWNIRPLGSGFMAELSITASR